MKCELPASLTTFLHYKSIFQSGKIIYCCLLTRVMLNFSPSAIKIVYIYFQNILMACSAKDEAVDEKANFDGKGSSCP